MGPVQKRGVAWVRFAAGTTQERMGKGGGRNASATAKEALQAQLDEMMGKERNVPVEARVNRVVKFDDDDVDKYWLCGLSPHTVLKHTKGDLGLWEKITDDGAKEIWDALPQEKKDEYGYEYELMRFLEQLVSDTDRNIRRNKERVDRDNANKQVALSKDTLVQVEALAKQIAELHQSAEKLGEEGNLDESMAAMAKAEVLLTQKTTLENPVNASKEKIMEVCEICCNFMTVSDRESESEAAKARIAEHLNGKQHQAWEKIRNKLAELRAMNEGKGPPPKPRPGMSAPSGDGERRRSRSPRRDDRDRRDERDRGGYRDRDYRRDYSDRDRDGYRDRRRDDRDGYRDYRGGGGYRDDRGRGDYRSYRDY